MFSVSVKDRAQLSGTCSKSKLVRGGPVESKLNSYFQLLLFRQPANYRCGWHRNRVWEQRNRDCQRSRTGKSGFRGFEDCCFELAC